MPALRRKGVRNLVNCQSMMRLIRHLLLLTILLLGSCVTPKQVKNYLAKEKNKPAAEAIVTEWLERNRAWYAAKAAKDFPAGEHPAIADTATTAKETAVAPAETMPLPPTRKSDPVAAPPEKTRPRTAHIQKPAVEWPDVSGYEKTIREKELAIQENTAKLGAARAALHEERQAHGATKQQLKATAADRNYYKEKNRKKVWALVAMGIFAALYIIFKVAASRVRTS